MYDAHIEHSGEFCDFVEFCYAEHDPYHEHETCEFDNELKSHLANVRRIVNNNGLHEDMMRGAKVARILGFRQKLYACILNAPKPHFSKVAIPAALFSRSAPVFS